MTKILLVEDNEMNRDMLSRRLERKGYRVIVAVDGQQGVDMAQAEAPDAHPHGHEPAGARRLGGHAPPQGRPRHARNPRHRPDRPRDGSDRDKALQAGCDDYDTKPVEFPRLLRKMTSILARERAS